MYKGVVGGEIESSKLGVSEKKNAIHNEALRFKAAGSSSTQPFFMAPAGDSNRFYSILDDGNLISASRRAHLTRAPLPFPKPQLTRALIRIL